MENKEAMLLVVNTIGKGKAQPNPDHLYEVLEGHQKLAR